MSTQKKEKEQRGLVMKYFVLKPRGDDEYAQASRAALAAYAGVIAPRNPKMAQEIRDWVREELRRAAQPE